MVQLLLGLTSTAASHDIGQGPSTSSPVQNANTTTTILNSMAHKVPSPTHQLPTTTLHDIDLRICTLTMILSILDPQASSPTKNPSSIKFKVVMHIVMLLTCGVDKEMGWNI